MPRLINKDTGAVLGTITDDDLELLVDQLEETDGTDDDYFIDAATIDLLKDAGASAHLLAVLTRAVGNGDGLEIRHE